MLEAPEYPSSWNREGIDRFLDELSESWGQGGLMNVFLPSFAADERARRIWARYQRMGGSPGTARALMEANTHIDVRHVLPHLQVPTLVIHRTDERVLPIFHGRYLANHIP